MESLVSTFSATPGAAWLLATIVAASLIGLYVAPAMLERNLFRPQGLLERSDYATLITSGFLHADLAHLFFNAFTFWAFAFSLERAIGTPRFLVLYFFGLLVSDLGTYLKHRHDPGYRSLGASGAILAVLFASIVYFPTNAIFIMPIPVPIPAPLFAVAYLAYSYYASTQSRGRVNHDAHIAGAVAGLVFVALTDLAAIGNAVRHFFG